MAETLSRMSAGTVDRELRKIGEVGLQVEVMEAEMLRELDEVKEGYTADLKPLRARLTELIDRLAASCKGARAELFEGQGQRLQLGFGQVSYRAGSIKLELRAGVDEESAIKRLPPRLRRYIRERRSLDKAGLKTEAMDGGITGEELEAIGLDLVQGEETWTVKADHEAVRAAIGKA